MDFSLFNWFYLWFLSFKSFDNVQYHNLILENEKFSSGVEILSEWTSVSKCII